MNIPNVCDRVRLEGHEDLLVVVHVNAQHGSADLARIERAGFLSDVPLSLTPSIEQDMAEA